MFDFGSPYSFFLLLPLAAAAWFVYRRRVRSGVLFSATAQVAASHGTWRTRASNVLPALALLGLALTVVALARPQTVFSKNHRSADVIAVEMVVDVSGSMEALDLSTRSAAGVKLRSRLDAVKDTFADFVGKRTDDLIGLVTFGGYASTRVPLTADHEALLHVLRGVEIPRQSVDAGGQVLNQEELLTAIGDAMATACARLEHAEPKSKVIVLLTDGESNTGIIKPDEATQVAKKMGIKVYTIGVGSTGPAPFRARDMFGRETILTAQVSLDENLLRKIADATGGRYFNVRDPHGLEQAMEHIDKLEKTNVQRDIYNQYDEWFAWFLAPGVCLVVLGAGVNMVIARRLL